jgi:hypothetical protein
MVSQSQSTEAIFDTGATGTIITNAIRHSSTGTSVGVQTGVALYCTYCTYVPYSLSPHRILNPDTASSVISFLRHIVISHAFVASYPL